ncbi:MAG: LuxR C-terminal-related transcriptional regulator [Bacteroidales bacterium]|nr:LuxR C-terminal-related transcriptional regulator [Bacteroidales bacterium]
MKIKLLSLTLMLILVPSVNGKDRFIMPPDSLFSDGFTRSRIDSVRAGFVEEARTDYPGNVEAGADYLLGEWAYYQSLPALSRFYVGRAIQTASGSEALLSDCYSQLSVLDQREGNLESAIHNARLGLEIDRKLGNKENISSSLNNIAGFYLTSGQFEVAKKYIDEALEVERQLGRDDYLAIRLGMASEIALRLEDYQQALEYSGEAFLLDSLAGRTAKAAVRRCQRAAALKELHRDDAAMRDLKAAVPVLDSARNLNSLAIANAQIGEIALKNGDLSTAGEAFVKCLELSEKLGNSYIASRGHKGLYRLYRNSAVPQSLDHLEKSCELQEKLNSDRTSEQLARFNVQYETLKKEQTIADQRRTLRYGAAGAVLLVILCCLSAVLAVYRRRAAKLLEEKNAMLVREALEKDRLLALAGSNVSKSVKEEILSLASAVGEMPKINLTSREVEIAKLSADGLLSKEIADRLGISQRTVETHKNNLYRKLGINNAVELVNYVRKAGL